MKAIIPVAGAGVNLRPHTYTQPKPLLLVAGKPIISYIIDQLYEAGISDFIFVLGYLGDKIKLYLESSYPDINKTYVHQNQRKGLGHAVLLTKEVVSSEEIVIFLGDTIVEMNLDLFLKESGSALTIQKVQDPRQFGVVEVNESGYATRVVEKPAIPKSNNALVGVYKIKEVDTLFECLKEVENEANESNSEIHLANGLMKMIERDISFKTAQVSNWYDCGKKEILLETNRELLKKRVMDVGTRFVYNDSIIIPPVVFGNSCKFENAIIGPNVAMGDNVYITNSLISDSILGNFVELSGAVLKSSVIGNDAVIKGLSQSLSIGDNNVIDFS